ncbi:cellulose-binding domain-containing protein [Micromonospora sp. WMMD980]|uniref:cellulose-binding domain-containing protein n=1 Tax=Micromonospora sp. WMMD980 TaxID=3016088 RepID=UPI003242EF75
MSTLIWDHYQFTGDLAFLQANYPALRGAAQFFLDTLVVHPTLNYLVTNPSNSPELPHHANASVCAGPTMDNQILRDLFDAAVRAGEVLGVDATFRSQVRTARDRLPPSRIGSRGNVQEWLADWVETERTHRHVSHLYGLHPSNQITKRGTPALHEAARRTLELRGDDGTGWSLAWKINFWARLEDGARAHKLLRDLVRTDRLAPNMFDLHPSFQIDGNFGATSGIAEMLLHSHAGELNVLPALPSAWPTGRVAGLRGRGGHTVGMSWSNGQVDEITVRADRDGTLRMRSRLFTGGFTFVDAADGSTPATTRPESDVVQLTVRAGHTYRAARPGGTPSPTPTATPTTSTSPTPTTSSPAPSGARATYAVTGSWSGGFQGEVTVTAGATAIRGWTVSWTFPNGQVINQIWGGSHTQSGANVTVRNVDYNGTLAAGASTTFGFIGTVTGANNPPTNLTCTTS